MSRPAASTSPQAAPGALRALWGIVRFLRYDPWRVAGSIGFLLVNIGIELTLPQLLGRSITGLGRATTPGGEPFPLVRMVLLFLGLVTLRTVVGMVLGPLRNITAQRTLGRIRGAVYDALQRQTFAWHDNARTGELISRASTDVGRLQEFIFVCLLFSVDVAAGLLGALVLIFWLSPMLGLMTLVAMVPTVVAMGWFAAKLQPRWKRVHERHSALSTVIQENIAGVRVVRAFARESAEIAKFRERRDAFLKEMFSTVNEWAARVPFAQFLFGLGVPLVLAVGGRAVIHGQLALGDLAKVVFYLLGLGGRIGVIGQVTNIVQNASSSAQRIQEILQAPIALPNGSRGVESVRGEIQFEAVTFQHGRAPSLRVEIESEPQPAATPPDSKTQHGPAVREVSFHIPAGSRVALVGSTGAGKSTCLSMIPRFYDPTSGVVRLDGVDLRELDLAGLRAAVGVVFQETFLFSTSLAENIAFGRPGASREEIVRVATAAQAHEFITALPQGYDTVVGERGISLSGGQRQRIAIARALLMDPAVLLLDDATSAIDPGTERKIRDALSSMRRGRTTVMVSQRMSAVRDADLILVMKEGRLVEQGTHDALIAAQGAYATLFQSQSTHESVSAPEAASSVSS